MKLNENKKENNNITVLCRYVLRPAFPTFSLWSLSWFFFVVFFFQSAFPLFIAQAPLFLSVTRRDRIEHSEEENEHILYIMNASEEEENDWLVSAQMQMIIRHSTKKKEIWGRAEFITFHGKVNPANTRAFCQVKKNVLNSNGIRWLYYAEQSERERSRRDLLSLHFDSFRK